MRAFPIRSSLLRSALLSFCLALPSATVSAEPSQQALQQQLRSKRAEQRVSAALGLAKHKHASTRRALEAALKDPIPKVRAAAAAALQRLGDRRAVVKLEPLLQDDNEAVRRQAKSAIDSLERSADADSVAVGVGDVRNRDGKRSRAFGPIIKRAAEQTLSSLPGVRVHRAASSELLLEGQLVRLEGRSRADAYAVSATVEFVITEMPNRLIKGRVSGAATVMGERRAAKNRKLRSELQREAVAAATQSALSDAQRAFASSR